MSMKSHLLTRLKYFHAKWAKQKSILSLKIFGSFSEVFEKIQNYPNMI